MRKCLDNFYRLCGILSALTLMSMVLLIAAQIVARFFNAHIPSSDDISGYMVAWTTFLGLCYAMHKDVHIRVDLFVNLLSSRFKLISSLMATAFGLVMLIVFLYYIFLSVKEAYDYGDVTTGLIPFPLWIIQIPFAFGVFALSVSMVDRLVTLILFGLPREQVNNLETISSKEI